ncbi:MAG: hypothetical protein IJV41_05585 [Oscillospiraceae bacterium]|nr:hypothetical protein [Oscillospiraceae bacterium]MBQ9686009.1 hypothetical protein [Oscillospiraceae bacterium]
MKKLLSLLLCLLLLLQLSCFVFAEDASEDATTVIRTAEELVRFAQNCASDTYSAGRSFALGADIDLTGTDFSPIPWFGGSFDGRNHRITGLRYTRDGSRQGLFRVIAEGATVSSLRVSGTVTPGGTGCYVGGIAGVNSGTVTDCSFEGTVSGMEDVGGVVGHNTVTGTVARSGFTGDVTAEHQVGGIAGLNDGILLECSNLGAVNTVAITPREQSVDSLLNAHFDISQVSEDDFLNLSNIGGIAGDNTGIIDQCRNNGAVGYRSTGYNVGGIAGKSSGYVSGCRNAAEINGRRDTGGIVGQLIPFSDWDLSSGKLDALSWQISILNGQLNNLSYNFDSYGDSIYSSVDRLRGYTADMTNALFDIAQYAADNDERIIQSLRDSIYVDPTTGEISFSAPNLGNVDTNALSYALSNMYGESTLFIDLARDATGSLAADIRRVSDQITNIFNVLFSTISDLTVITPETDDLSESEAYSRNTGAVASCTNLGTVIAENNAGGILGTAGFEVEFDMEDRLNISDYLTSNSRHSLFAAVRDCVCSGEVSAKGGTVGGIAGAMDLGVIVGSTVTGSVSGGSSDYVGGLVGYTTGSVWYSWSRSLLHGGKYVGGVAGYASKICNCKAWVHFEQQNEYAGAIAGWVEEGPVTGNYYVSVTPGGVDGISISGETDALSEEDFLRLDGVPAQFGTVTVQYVFEGKVLSEETVRFGGTLRHVPVIENRDGMYWSWDLPEQEHIYSALSVEGSFHSPRSTIAGEGDPPAYLVEGRFYDGQKLELLPLPTEGFSEAPLAAQVIWVSGYEGELTVRMLTDTDGMLYLVQENGQSVPTSYTRDGRYIVFRVPNGGSFFYMGTNPNAPIAVEEDDLRTVGIILIPFVILFIVVIILISRKYRKEIRPVEQRVRSRKAEGTAPAQKAPHEPAAASLPPEAKEETGTEAAEGNAHE